MSAMSGARLLAAGSAWRLTGLGPAGRALVSAVTSDNTNDRILAAILLTRAGDRSVRVVADALAAGAAPSDLVDVLASIGTPTAREQLRTASSSSRPDLASAAQRALRTLDQLPPPSQP